MNKLRPRVRCAWLQIAAGRVISAVQFSRDWLVAERGSPEVVPVPISGVCRLTGRMRTHKFARVVFYAAFLLCLCAWPGALAAQTAIYGEFTGGTVPVSNTQWMFGPTVGLYHDNGLGLLALGYDVRGSFLRRGNSAGASTDESLNLLQVGVRAAVTPHVLPIKPYVEALGGYGGLTVGRGTARQSGSHAAYQFLGGVDFTFLPRVDWRVVEFSYGRLSGLGDTYAPKTLSTGIVFRLP